MIYFFGIFLFEFFIFNYASLIYFVTDLLLQVYI